jgi:hypothetical protein
MGRGAAIFGAWLVTVVPGTLVAEGVRVDQKLERPETGLRSTDEASAMLIEEGLRRSVTLLELAADIEASDIRVMVHVSNEPGVWRGETRLVSASPGVRILLAKINSALDKRERLAVLGHELQHAREVAAARDVVDHGGMLRLFKKLGYPASPGSRNYETSAAQSIERQVRLEVARNR